MTFTYALAHYFYPRHSNNHKAKLIHTSTLLILAVFLVLFQFALQYTPRVGVRILGYASNISPDKVISLTNQQRANNGLPALQYNSALAEAAKDKGEHMLANDYWAHVAPDGTEPWYFFNIVGYKYKYAGENLARDFADPNSAMDAWMASPSHRDNILSAKYKDIGVAVVEGDLAGVDTTIIVQLFGTPLVDTTPQVPIAEAQAQNTEITPTPQNVATLVPTMTPAPTSAPALIAQISPMPTVAISTGEVNPAGESGNLGPNALQKLVSPFDTTKSVSLATIVLLLLVMVIDGIVTSRKKIPRIGGKTFAHMAFLGMVLALVLIARAGNVL